MKQLMQNLKNGDTIVADVPIPTPQPGEVLVHTAASLVSAGTERMVVEFAEKSLVGKARSRPDLVRQVFDKARREGLLTTLEAAFGRLDQPMPLGYSSAGTIVSLAEGATNDPGLAGFHAGQRVACAGGGFAVHAEYACVPRNLIAALPDEVDFESAAFTTLGAIALHGFRLTQTQIGERIAVIGLGLLGLLAVEIAIAAGCRVFGVDLDPRRVTLAESLGAQAVLRGQAIEAGSSFSGGRGCDAILICADTPSTDPVELAGAIARDRARVVAVGAVGLHLPRKIYYEKELTFLNSRSYGPGRYDPTYEEKGVDYPLGYVRWSEGRNLEAVVDLLAQKRMDVKALISHRFSIETAPQAYELITGKRKEPFLGVLLTYPQPEIEAETTTTIQRSDFLRSSTATEIPAALSQTAKEPVGTGASPRVSVGVLGAGNFATAAMLPALKATAGVNLVGVASASGMNASYAAGRFRFRYATSDSSRVLEDPQINTIAVLTRHNLHAPQVIAALQAGKHVFCEKPLGLNQAELDSIQQTLAEAQAKSIIPLLTVGFNRRFAPLAQKMKQFLDERKEPLIAHYRVNAGYIPLNHWTHDPEQGGGRLIGEGCHFIDFITYLVGAAPSNVTVRGLPDAGRYKEDNLSITLAFPDGSLGLVSYLANGDKAFPKERVEAFSAGRVAVLDDYRSLELIFNGRRKTHQSRLRQDKGHRAEWAAFANAIQADGPPSIPYDQIFGVMTASFASVQSLRSGKTILINAARDTSS